MASTYSDRLKLELMETGANAATWGTNTNNNLNVLDAYNNGYISKSVAGSTNVTLTASDASPSSEASNKVLELTGTLTGNIIVLIPARESNYIVYNNTSGAFTLSIGCDDGASGALGTTATVTQGIYNWIYSDGTNVTIAELNANASTISTGTLNNARLSALPNSVLENSAITINSTSVSLGGSINVGDITGVTAGDGLTGGGTTGDVTLNVDLSELTTSTSDADGDFFVVVDSANAQKKLTKGNINLSGFNNDAGFSTTTGTVTSVGVTAGSGLTGGGTVTTSGTITVNVGAGTGIDVAADAISVDVSDFMSNGSNNRVLTATGTDAMNAEANLTFDGSTLYASGNVGFGIASPTGQAGERILHLHNSAADSVALHMTNSTSGSADGDGFTIRMLANEDVEFVNDDLNSFEWKNSNGVIMDLGADSFLRVGSESAPDSSNFGFALYTTGGGYTSGHWLRQSRNVTGGGTVCQHYGSVGSIRFMGDGDAENTNNSYGAISDRKLKENETAASSQWEDIKALQIKNYNLKEHPDRTHIGVVAQDLEEAGMTGLVKDTTDYDDEGNDLGTVTKTVKYSVLYMKAVKALQEAMIRIENLETEVNSLKNQ